MVLSGSAQAWCVDMALGHTPWTWCSATMCEPGARPWCLAGMCGHSAWPWALDTASGHGGWAWSRDMVVGHEAWTWWLGMEHGPSGWTWSVDTEHGRSAQTQSMDTVIGHRAWTWWLPTLHGHSAQFSAAWALGTPMAPHRPQHCPAGPSPGTVPLQHQPHAPGAQHHVHPCVHLRVQPVSIPVPIPMSICVHVFVQPTSITASASVSILCPDPHCPGSAPHSCSSSLSSPPHLAHSASAWLFLFPFSLLYFSSLFWCLLVLLPPSCTPTQANTSGPPSPHEQVWGEAFPKSGILSQPCFLLHFFPLSFCPSLFFPFHPGFSSFLRILQGFTKTPEFQPHFDSGSEEVFLAGEIF